VTETLDLVYLAGPPAAGKSALMAAITGRCDKVPVAARVPHAKLVSKATGDGLGIELGRPRARFPGTDTLSMSIGPAAITWLGTRPAALILGEGDRLAYPGFLAAAKTAGYTVTLVYVTAPDSVLDYRCEERGSAQNETWRKGRATKAARLASWAQEAGLRVTGADTAANRAGTLAAMLREEIPVLETLWS